MSIWDFLHPGLSGEPSGIGHFQMDQLGRTHRSPADGMSHGSSHLDALGHMHHQASTGVEVGTSHVDALATFTTFTTVF